ncbi:MAG: hypothetical protein NTV21_12430 [Planctomycetota bacterium]|nr:hypothetical protein [Planctomycetota bacterium]
MESTRISSPSARRVLAVASPGGHFEQLQLLADAWEGCEVAYVSVGEEMSELVSGARYYSVPDSSRHQPLQMLRGVVRLVAILRRERPEIVVSTGAAPGLLALALGRLFGARTAWIDSVANVERLSLSGRLAGRLAHLWMTQWEHLESHRGPRFAGGVL